MVFCAMLKCTKPANGQKEAENDYNAPSKTISDLSPLPAFDDNNCSQTGHEVKDQPNNSSVALLSTPNLGASEEKILIELQNLDQKEKKTFWAERSISFPSPSKLYQRNKTDGGEDQSTKEYIRIKLKSIQSRYTPKSSTFSNYNNSENKSEQSKDGNSTVAATEDGLAFDKTASDDGNLAISA